MSEKEGNGGRGRKKGGEELFKINIHIVEKVININISWISICVCVVYGGQRTTMDVVLQNPPPSKHLNLPIRLSWISKEQEEHNHLWVTSTAFKSTWGHQVQFCLHGFWRSNSGHHACKGSVLLSNHLDSPIEWLLTSPKWIFIQLRTHWSTAHYCTDVTVSRFIISTLLLKEHKRWQWQVCPRSLRKEETLMTLSSVLIALPSKTSVPLHFITLSC